MKNFFETKVFIITELVLVLLYLLLQTLFINLIFSNWLNVIVRNKNCNTPGIDCPVLIAQIMNLLVGIVAIGFLLYLIVFVVGRIVMFVKKRKKTS
jgi:hypothetical protein